MSGVRWHAWAAIGFGIASMAGDAFGGEEHEARPGKPLARVSAMDANRDGKLSRDEHAAGARRMFEVMDADADGKVTVAEMDAAHERITGKKARPDDKSAAEKMKVVDTDGDGTLTAEEHAAGTKTMFDRMDADGDGQLTRAERNAAHRTMLKKSGE